MATLFTYEGRPEYVSKALTAEALKDQFEADLHFCTAYFAAWGSLLMNVEVNPGEPCLVVWHINPLNGWVTRAETERPGYINGKSMHDHPDFFFYGMDFDFMALVD